MARRSGSATDLLLRIRKLSAANGTKITKKKRFVPSVLFVAIELPHKAQKSQNKFPELNLWHAEADRQRIYFFAHSEKLSAANGTKITKKKRFVPSVLFVAIELPHKAQKSYN